jgi:DNA-binding beta-propeller fold protein YncE
MANGNGSPWFSRSLAMPPIFRSTACALIIALPAEAQITTTGFPNVARAEAAGTLLSHPLANDSEATGRTTTLNYLNGWLIVGAEGPGSRPGSDLEMRVYDLSNPSAPVRRMPSDFGHAYPNNRWHQGNAGWNAHGSAQAGTSMLPEVMRVQSFGGPVERGAWNIPNGVPDIGAFPVGWNRSAQAGPWLASFPWYGSPDEDFTIQRVWRTPGGNQYQTLATWDHVGPYGGGDWHPMFFGDLLIYARHGSTASDGIVVYRLQYHNFDDPQQRAITPQFVGSLAGGFQGYWPNLFSDGTGLYVIGSATDILMGADLTQAADPAGDGSVRLAASLNLPNFTNASYPVYQDQFGFIHNRKIDITRFLAGDANPVVLALNEGAPNFVDTSQMSLPLGNLWVTGGYPHLHGGPDYQAQGMAVWVHQQAPDTTPPRVAYHIPQTNRTHYPRHAPLSFLVHEHPRHGGPRNGIDFLVRPVLENDALGDFVPGFLIHDFSGNMTFTPDTALAADTTYQVDFPSDPANGIGFTDAAGNFIESYSYRFSTGGGIDAAPPPAIASVTAGPAIPAPGQQTTVTVAATGEAPLEYRYNFAGEWSAWTSEESASHTYQDPGRPRVLVQARDGNGQIAHGSVRLLVIDPLPPGPRPTQSSTLAIGDHGGSRHLWVVNPDADTVSVLDATSGEKLTEHVVGRDPRGIARDANGRYWITCQGDDEIRILNPDGTAHATLPLAYGSAPFGIAASPDGQHLYVTLHGSARLRRYAAATPLAAPLDATTVPFPRAIALSADGQRVLVTRFISPDLHGQVAEHHGGTLAHVRTIGLGVSISWDNGDRSGGTPNYLAGIAISPDGSRAAVVSKQDNVHRGLRFGVGDLTHETTVRAVISFIDLTSNQEIANTRRDFDNSDSPSAVTWSPLGDTIFVTLQGNNRLVGIDALNLAPVTGGSTSLSTETSPAVIAFDLATGLAPQGVLLDPASQRIFTQDFMGRSVTVRDAQPFLAGNLTAFPPVSTTATVADETLEPAVLLGKQIFYNAADPRMSADSYLSCASCHIDGGHDGRAWDFTGRGEGLRRTTDLRGRSGTGHGNVHWSGNFDEIQDFEHDIRGPFGGTGFLELTPQQFATLHPTPATGKAGLSADLDALAAYLASLGHDKVPRSPHRAADGSLTAAGHAGRAVFEAQSCTACHGGDSFTNSAHGPIASHPLADVGSRSLLSGFRLGDDLTGVDVPSLHGLHAAHNYLHHGEAKNLADVFSYTGGTLHLAHEAALIPAPGNPASIGSLAAWQFNPAQGGGGFTRGLIGGNTVTLRFTAGAPEQARVSLTGVNGGSGGPARIGIRYLRNYGSAGAVLRVNGNDHPFTVLTQSPDFGWQQGGWRWHTAELTLNPGTANTVEVLPGAPDWNEFSVNAILVSNADTLAAAQPHRAVTGLAESDRNHLLAYLRQIDGRDAAGVPLADPSQPAPGAPVILSSPGDITFATGNTLRFHVTVAGGGPFTYQWRRGGTEIGGDSPELEITNLQPADSGAYTVTVTNAAGQAASPPAQVVINPALAIATTGLPLGFTGIGYLATLAAEGGTDARTWSIQSGILPPGLALDPASGEITGTPAAAARASLVVRVADRSGSATQALDLDIAPPGGFVDDPDLVLHFTFDEGAGTRVWDISPAGNNHSTTVSNANWVADGRFGGAYGAAAMNGSFPSFHPANQGGLGFDPRGDEFTISTWVRTSAATHYHIIFGKDDHAAGNTQLRLWTTDPAHRVQAVTGSQYGSSFLSSPPVNNGQWQLLTLVNFNDNGTWRTRVYQNDGATYTQFNSGAGGTAPELFRIGAMSAGWNNWRGQMDDFRIYHRALGQAEIAAIHSPPPAAGQTYAQWLLENLTPAQLADPARNAPGADLSGNGVSNLMRFALGHEVIQPLAIERHGAQVRLGFSRNPAARGVVLTVEQSATLTPGSWQTIATSENGGEVVALPGITVAEGGETTLDFPPDAGPRAYRLRATLVP